jgi:hypothetical protein
MVLRDDNFEFGILGLNAKAKIGFISKRSAEVKMSFSLADQ